MYQQSHALKTHVQNKIVFTPAIACADLFSIRLPLMQQVNYIKRILFNKLIRKKPKYNALQSLAIYFLSSARFMNSTMQKHSCKNFLFGKSNQDSMISAGNIFYLIVLNWTVKSIYIHRFSKTRILKKHVIFPALPKRIG